MADQEQQPAAIKRDAEDTATAEEPPSKKLRSSEPDLKVILKYTEAAGNPAEKSYEMYAQVFARQSKFVDTLLSVDMKEKETREIVLHDVSPDIFEPALELLDDPSAVLSMRPPDAMRVVEFYDKYEFATGLKLCDTVLHKYVEKQFHRSSRPDDLDFLVNVIVAAEKFQLKETKASGVSGLFARFFSAQEGHYGAEMFSVVHIRKLQPLFIHQELMLPVQVSKEELQSPLFPKYFVEVVSHRYTRKILKAIVVCGTNSTASGKYIRKDGRRFEGEARPTSWNGRLAQCFVDRTPEGDWGIICRYLPGRTETVLWKCPNSQSLECPPVEPWVCVSTDTIGTPEHSGDASTSTPMIKYIKYDNNK